jgi:hypothetical protein
MLAYVCRTDSNFSATCFKRSGRTAHVTVLTAYQLSWDVVEMVYILLGAGQAKTIGCGIRRRHGLISASIGNSPFQDIMKQQEKVALSRAKHRW